MWYTVGYAKFNGADAPRPKEGQTMRVIFMILAMLALVLVAGPAYAVCDAPHTPDFFSVAQAEQKKNGPGFGSFEGLADRKTRGIWQSKQCVRIYVRHDGPGKSTWAWSVGTLVLPGGKLYTGSPSMMTREQAFDDFSKWSVKAERDEKKVVVAEFEYDSAEDGIRMKWIGNERDGQTLEGFLARVAPDPALVPGQVAVKP